MEKVLLADLRAVVPALMMRIQDIGTLTPDLGLLLASLPSLVNVLRYGSARKVDTGALSSVVDGVIARACIALPYGLRGLADEAALDTLRLFIGADQAVRLLQSDDHLAAWFEALGEGATSELSHPLLAGRCSRILTEQGQWTGERAAQQLALRCSPGVAPLLTARWLEGFLQGSGALLAHSDPLWNIVNGWLLTQPADVFIELLPLLRRTFGSFSVPERRELGVRVARASAPGGGMPVARPAVVDRARAQRVLPILHTIFGTRPSEETIHDE